MRHFLASFIIFCEIFFILILTTSIVLDQKKLILYIVSDSMEPVISVGDFVLILKQKSYKKQEIVAYSTSSNPEYIWVHRIIEKQKDCYFTKGDNAQFIDNYKICNENILGKVIFYTDF